MRPVCTGAIGIQSGDSVYCNERGAEAVKGITIEDDL